MDEGLLLKAFTSTRVHQQWDHESLGFLGTIAAHVLLALSENNLEL